VRLDVGRGERLPDCLLTEVNGNIEVGVVRFSEASQSRVARQRQREATMIDTGRLGKAHEPRFSEFGELARHLVLVVPVRCGRHRSAGDVRGAAAIVGGGVRGRGICCCGHAYTYDRVLSKADRGQGELEHNPPPTQTRHHNDGTAIRRALLATLKTP
jgi:hypothetical protein